MTTGMDRTPNLTKDKRQKKTENMEEKKMEKVFSIGRVDIGSGNNHCKPYYRSRIGDTDGAKEIKK